MPPRTQPHGVSIPSMCQCFRTRPSTQAIPECPPTSRPAHQTRRGIRTRREPRIEGTYVNPEQTRLRRNMFEWLNGQGKALRDPLPNSTNYMSAYDKQGNLIRARRQRDNREEPKEAEEVVVPEEMEEEIVAREIKDGKDEVERQEAFEVRAAARARKAGTEARGGLPRERQSDMRPYPLNPNFRSESVLDEELREEIYRQAVEKGVDVSTISAAFGVDIRRVAAVVRLKTVEKQWLSEGKRLAKPYADAVLAMLPKTPYHPTDPQQKIVAHETINDLPVHPHTRNQIFYPTSESRQFTREDAAKAFSETLLPADKRIPHPELITLEKEHLEGIDRNTRWARQQERDAAARVEREVSEEKRRKWEERTQRVVAGRRWDFKFQDISAERTGRDGRSRSAVGVRYGMPHEDRKRGMVKIPTSVE